MEGCYERVLSSGGSGAVLGGESRAFRRGRVERVEMRCGLEAAMTYSDGYKHMFFGDLVTWRLGEGRVLVCGARTMDKGESMLSTWMVC